MDNTAIPTFPEFVALGAHHQAIINELIRANHLYSDYNFISLWSWDHEENLKISFLHDNLIIRFQDYVDRDAYFYSFFGTNEVDQTAIELLEFSEQEGFPELKLIPEFVVERLEHKDKFVIGEDRDSFDYIVAVSDIVELKNKEFASKRRSLNHFNATYANKATVRELDIKNPDTRDAIVRLAKHWSQQTNSEDDYATNEGRAIGKMLGNHHAINTDDLHLIGIYLNDELRAFSITEILRDGFAMGHYKKADRDYKGIGVALDHITAKTLQEKGVSHINHEQDLGIEGLRKAKLASNPVYFLKKYTLARAKE